MAETDRISNLLTAEARGVYKVASNMKKDGMSIETIARLTDLSVREIENL